LTSSNFDELVLESEELWLVEFFAPWCGHCKSLAPHWEKAAGELGGIANLGALDATVYSDLAGKYGVKGYPTIKIFGADKRHPTDFNGGRDSSSIIQYAKNLAEANIKPKQITQLTSQDVFDSDCGKASVCLLSVLPHILDSGAKDRNGYLEVLKKVAAKNKGKPFSYVWVEAGAQPELESTLGIGGYGYPAVAAIATKKLKYTLLAGSFTMENINSFLISPPPLQSIAAFPVLQHTEAWNGKDAPKSSSDSDSGSSLAAAEEEDPELAELLKDL